MVYSEACTPLRWISLPPPPASRASASETLCPHASPPEVGCHREAAGYVSALDIVVHINFKLRQIGKLNREQSPSRIPFYLISYLLRMNELIQRNEEREVLEGGERWEKKHSQVCTLIRKKSQLFQGKT